MKQKNILFIIGKITGGGAERACVNIAEALAEKYKVTIIIYDDTKYNSCNLYECKVPVIKIEYGRTKHKMLKKIKEIRKIKKKLNITHSISFCTYANFINVITKRKDKTIISIRNYMSESEKQNKKARKRQQIALKLSNEIVAVSRDVQQDLITNFKAQQNKIIVIPNFINNNKITNNIKNEKIDNIDKKIFIDNNVVITVGRLTEQKGQWHIIRAFKEVVKQIPKAKLVILGEGNLKKYLETIIEKLNLKNNVYLLGFKNNPYRYLKKSYIFVLTSYFEGMPNVILEAMECDLPIIATDCKGGNREILIDENNKVYGILLPVCSGKKYIDEPLDEQEKKIANAIIKLLKERETKKHYEQQSKLRIQNFYKEQIIKKWENLIEE